MVTRKKSEPTPPAAKAPAQARTKAAGKATKQATEKAAKPAGKAAAVRLTPAPAAPRAAGAASPRLRMPRATASSTALPGYDPAAQFDKLPAEQAPRTARTASRSLTAWPVVPGLPQDFFAGHTGAPLTEAVFQQAAQALGCEPAAVKAVAEVESRGAAFDSLGRPTILYERHVFARCTRPAGRFDASHPDLSLTKKGYGPGGYGGREQQWQRLAQAYALDPDAALKAVSWGTFQILGENHRECGHADAAEFVRAMTVSQVEHLQAFVRFVASHRLRLQALRTLDWATFARYYNGPDYARYSYDQKMAAAYTRHRA
jgi:N-acetylmuramidase